MASEVKKEIQLEIAQACSWTSSAIPNWRLTEQRAPLEELNQIVRSTDEFKTAEVAGRLIKIATGDGMALVFYNNS